MDVWLSPAYCNPPYSRAIGKWLEKFNEQAQLGNKVVALLPAKTGTRWWYEGVVKPGADVMFLVGRVPFVGDHLVGDSAPNHDSALVFFEPDMKGRVTWLDWREKWNA